MFPVFLEVPHIYLNYITLFFKPLFMWFQIFLSRTFSDHRLRLLLVVFVILSRLGLSLSFSSLFWYVFFSPLFTFNCSGFRGSLVVIVCLCFLTFFGWDSVVGSFRSNLRLLRRVWLGFRLFIIGSTSLVFAQSCVLPLGRVVLLVFA